MNYDPVEQMKLEEKKRVVKFEELKQEVRDNIEEKIREKLGKDGEIIPLQFYPSNKLKEASAPVPVDAIKTKLMQKLVEDMLFTMYMCGGVGLAAPQVGLNQRLFVLDWSPEQKHPVVCINPEVITLGDESGKEAEACLSMPGVRVHVSRPKTAKVAFYERTGTRVEIDLSGWAARIFLHELDHLDGKMMFEHASVHQLERRNALKRVTKVMRGEKPKKVGKRRF